MYSNRHNKNKRKGEQAMHIEDTQVLVTEEIEMLKVVLYLVNRKQQPQQQEE